MSNAMAEAHFSPGPGRLPVFNSIRVTAAVWNSATLPYCKRSFTGLRGIQQIAVDPVMESSTRRDLIIELFRNVLQSVASVVVTAKSN